METACIRVPNDLFISTDSVHLRILILLNRTVACNIVHQPMLPQQLENAVGVYWPCTYLAPFLSE